MSQRKYLLSILFVFYSLYLLYSQTSKFHLIIEYNPNFSIITDAYAHEKFKFSHNVFLKSEYFFKEKFSGTLGIGFLNTGEKEVSDLGGQMGLQEISFIHDYNYITVSPGIKFYFKSFFINPEIGLGIHILSQTTQTIVYTNGKEEIKKADEKLISGTFNKITLPLLVSIGKEFPIHNIKLLLGIKSYFSINELVRGVPRNNHYYGIGVLAGIKF